MHLRVRGFTLIELLVSLAIITIISAIVLVKFKGFDNTVILKSVGFEVASSIRDAQIYSISASNIGVDEGDILRYRYPYGLSFTPNNTTYPLFRFLNDSPSADPYYSSDQLVSKIVNTFQMHSNIYIEDICVTVSGADRCTSDAGGNRGPSRVDISFRRPEFKALFNAPDAAPAIPSNTIQAGKIKLGSYTGSDIWVVEVGLLGQISVSKE